MSLKIENVKNILIPTDGSDHSIRAAELAISIAKLLGAKVMFVYVIDTLVSNQITKITQQENVEHELKLDGERYINYVVSLAKQAGVKATSAIVRGIPFEQILQIVKTSKMDLIVMGSFGRRGADRILIGSVAQHVIEYATCPILVVK
jgi:nucleotide-binding universal stress UspA family protein